MDDNTNIDLSQWYTAAQAADRLSRNSGKEIAPDYPRKLAQYGKIKAIKIGGRTNLYWKADIDPYIVEERGMKSGRARRIAAKPKAKKKN